MSNASILPEKYRRPETHPLGWRVCSGVTGPFWCRDPGHDGYCDLVPIRVDEYHRRYDDPVSVRSILEEVGSDA